MQLETAMTLMSLHGTFQKGRGFPNSPTLGNPQRHCNSIFCQSSCTIIPYFFDSCIDRLIITNNISVIDMCRLSRSMPRKGGKAKESLQSQRTAWPHTERRDLHIDTIFIDSIFHQILSLMLYR